MWLPRPIYESLPYALVAAGVALALLAFKVEAVPHGLFLGGGGLLAVVGLLLWLKRRDYRANHSQYDPHSLDE